VGLPATIFSEIANLVSSWLQPGPRSLK